jgi:1-aminocyclopropane-1-carboxylate deaminase
LPKHFSLEIINQEILLNSKKISLFIKREDLIHPFISGNKFRKLKYNLLEAKLKNKNTILTFGGAYSNHIAAVAFAGKENNFKTIGVIRGEELATKIDENPTLKFAKKCGMEFVFISRNEYQNKETLSFLNHLKLSDFYLLPEGGTNLLAIKGCEEILTDDDNCYNYICSSVGTGGTISGLINASNKNQKIIGFPALKGNFLQKDICKFAKKNNWELNNDYHFGGYAKVTPELIYFINQFNKDHHILLDPIYTGKMVFGVIDLINKNYFPDGSKILMIHTGGIQGINGINQQLKKKKQQLIII